MNLTEVARQAGLELGGPLEVFDLPHPAGQWVPSGTNLGHQFSSAILAILIAPDRAIRAAALSCPFRATNSVEQLDLGGQVAWRQMRITHGHLHRLVSEQLADRADRRATHHEPGRERVTQVMPPEVLDARVLAIAMTGSTG